MLSSLIFLSSGLFLGWSLGANDASNVFGTAVGSRMISFRMAALISSVFIILGAVLSGSGASHTLGKLGSVNEMAGAFTVALSAGLGVFLMTRLKLPVSTSQAIVGAIIGWNIFAAKTTDLFVVQKIASTWIICPLLSAFFAIILFFLIKSILSFSRIHILRLDSLTRFFLILAGAFGSFSLGANNIANVMGVFTQSAPFSGINLGIFSLSPAQVLFFLGGLAIASGVFTYSKKVMTTIGNDLFQLSPVSAFIAVSSHSLVLFIFSSSMLRDFIVNLGLPPIPLVPVSSSQAIVGAVIGIGIAKGARNIHYSILVKIFIGWIATPLLSALLCFVLLYIVQNVFLLNVFH